MSVPGDHVEGRFGASPAFAVGIEEELLLVEADGFGLSHSSAELLAAMDLPEGSAKHDLYAAQVELVTPVCTTVGEAVESLSGLRRSAAAAGATLMGAGLHPAGEFGDAEAVREDRYLRAKDELRGIVRRTPDCALHVHVGMPDADAAIRACNALRRRLPLLAGLAANSPFWHGVDSGLASARMVLRRGFPRVEPPPAFRDWADYVDTVDAIVEAAGLEDYTSIWWDVRPHPRFGTVEVRMMDAQASLERVAAIAALVQSLARQGSASGPGGDTPPGVLAASIFRATSDGISGELVEGGLKRKLGDLAREAVEEAAACAKDLNCADELAAVEQILDEGSGADLQRQAFRRGGMSAVLEHLVKATR
jgi:glutamate---cysteine ligase / carboxylate-amine ligase